MKKYFLLAALALIVVLMTWTGSTSQRSPNRVVTIGSFSKAIDYAPFFVARRNGWLDELATQHQLTTRFVEFQSLAPVNEAFATGQLDIVIEAETPALIGKAAGIDLNILALGSSLVQEIVVRKEIPIESIEQLKGRKIAVLAGTSSHYGLLKIADEFNLQPTDLQVLDMVPPDAKVAFESEFIDGWAVWPPWVEQEVLAGNARVLSGGDAFIQSIVGARGQFIKENPEYTKGLLGVIHQAKQWIQRNPQEAQSLVADEMNLPLEVVKAAWPKHDFSATLDSEKILDLQQKADFLVSQELVKQQVQISDLVWPLTKKNR